jgi:hypothetical protein
VLKQSYRSSDADLGCIEGIYGMHANVGFARLDEEYSNGRVGTGDVPPIGTSTIFFQRLLLVNVDMVRIYSTNFSRH